MKGKYRLMRECPVQRQLRDSCRPIIVGSMSCIIWKLVARQLQIYATF